ncbi:unnamed protein product [Brassica oleracea var. botrytis]|uniref:(rape) hypothetical protein n=1 Tax=Brassica napus TaxID=3708 RepID=A0A816I6I2_BRANA|nr:unnamed protein product [Brassica napus]
MATMEKPIDSSHGDSATSSNQVPLLQISRNYVPESLINKLEAIQWSQHLVVEDPVKQET